MAFLERKAVLESGVGYFENGNRDMAILFRYSDILQVIIFLILD
jgi:hypothetical protein